MRGPKAAVQQQGSIRKWCVAGSVSNGSSGGSGGGGSSSAGLRQADLTQLSGVVTWDSGGAGGAADSTTLLEGIPSTLYLGEDEVNRLKERLEDATTRECPSDHLVLLRRLSGMPCTRPLLEATQIGVTVGKLRKSADQQVAELAGRIVRVWKGQLAEHREQTKGAKRPAALSGAQRGGGR